MIIMCHIILNKDNRMSVRPSARRSPEVALTLKVGLPYPCTEKLRRRKDSVTGSAWTTTANRSAVRTL